MMSRHVVSRHVEFRVSQLNFELCVVRKMAKVRHLYTKANALCKP